MKLCLCTSRLCSPTNPLWHSEMSTTKGIWIYVPLPPSLGFPNVGKSSVLNSLVGRKVVSVSRTPGHTKYFQTYYLTPTVKLCDCPGLVFPSLVNKQLQVTERREWVGCKCVCLCVYYVLSFPQNPRSNHFLVTACGGNVLENRRITDFPSGHLKAVFGVES